MRSQTNQKNQTQKLGCRTKFSDKFSKYVVDVDKRLKGLSKNQTAGQDLAVPSLSTSSAFFKTCNISDGRPPYIVPHPQAGPRIT